MYPEYLINNDTQDICHRVSDIAKSNEPALREYCQEVSRQTDASSLAFGEACTASLKDAGAVFAAMMDVLREMLCALSNTSGVFHTRDGKEDFPAVCRSVATIEEKRLCLLSSVAEMTRLRRVLASDVADANRALHVLSIAKSTVPKELCAHYAQAIERVERAHARLTKADGALKEVQSFYMTLIESQMPVFMERLRGAADFNHMGAALDRNAIRALCGELLVLQNRVPNVSF